MLDWLKSLWKKSGLEVVVFGGAVIFVAAFLVTVARLIPPPHSPYASAREVVHQIYDDKNVYSGCSGVMIAPMRMLTAAHCVQSGAPWGAGEERAPVKVLAQDKGRDVALLAVALPCPCASVAGKDADVDELVLVVGYPMNDLVGAQIATEGRAQAHVFDKDLDGPRLRLSAPVAQGNSGGGVFVRRKDAWALVGIVTNVMNIGGLSRAPISHLSSAATLESIEAILTPRPPAPAADDAD